MLDIAGVNVAFGERCVLDCISLRVQPGKRIALLGASGSGKTTLLRVAAGLLCPTSGLVAANGLSPSWQKSERASFAVSRTRWSWPQVCLVPQGLGLFPNLSGEANILIGIDRERMVAARHDMIDFAIALDVAACLGRKPRGLSQGEQQRIAIIRALVRRPEYLLLDEPTAALDPISRRRLSELLLRLAEERGNAVVFATHDWDFAAQLAESYFAIHDGEGALSDSITEAVDFLSRVKVPSDGNA